MFRLVNSIGRNLYVVGWDRDGIASQRRTPIEPFAESIIRWDRGILQCSCHRNNGMRR